LEPINQDNGIENLQKRMHESLSAAFAAYFGIIVAGLRNIEGGTDYDDVLERLAIIFT